MDYTLVSALLLGLFSTIHCVGMCGGIMGALTLSLPQEVRARPVRLGLHLTAYNLGRVGSYALGGALLGHLGAELYALASPRGGYLVLQAGAALLLVGTGLYLAGWFPRFALVERIGHPLWRALEPLGRRLIPVKSLPQALAYGLIWGWLPCGLVYTALLMTIVSGGALEGALFMTAFGLGTLPAVAGVGILAGQLRQAARRPGLRRAGGVALILLGMIGFLFAEQFHAAVPLSHEQEKVQCQ